MTIDAVGQVEFNGLRLDGDYELQMIEGLRAIPDVRSSDLVRLGHHGLRAGTDWLGGRAVTIVVDVVPGIPEDFDDAMDALANAFVPAQSESPLSFRLRGIAGSQTARVYARPRRLSAPINVAYNQGVTEVAIELFCTDPLIYSDTESEQTTTLPTSDAGLEWDLSWPLNWGGTSAAGSINATNVGNFATPVVMRIDGPVTNPRIENVTVGRTIELDMTIADGEFIVIDTSERTVLLGGTASRYSSLTEDSQWWDLQPGANTINFRASTTDEALLTLTYRSAWV